MKLLQILVLLPLLALPVFTGCASMGASGTEPMLSAAGFRVKSPETKLQRELYDQLAPYKVQRGTYNGKVFYAYKDERQGVAYVGGEEEYQKYQQLAVQRRIASDQVAAAQMNASMARVWYGAYGYPGVYRY